MKYLVYKEIDNLSDQTEISNYFNLGYLIGRKSSGYMYQTRSLRINLGQWKLNSENRRILRKTNLETFQERFSSSSETYFGVENWRIQKLAKDFYLNKFEDVTFSASKIRKILNGQTLFNSIYGYKNTDGNKFLRAHSISYDSPNETHYAFPFYNLDLEKNTGMGMMIGAIQNSKNMNKKYFYLGGVTRKSDLYKLQFECLEWWDIQSNSWNQNLSKLKELLYNL